jgi:hypothetical protein
MNTEERILGILKENIWYNYDFGIIEGTKDSAKEIAALKVEGMYPAEFVLWYDKKDDTYPTFCPNHFKPKTQRKKIDKYYNYWKFHGR